MFCLLRAPCDATPPTLPTPTPPPTEYRTASGACVAQTQCAIDHVPTRTALWLRFVIEMGPTRATSHNRRLFLVRLFDGRGRGGHGVRSAKNCVLRHTFVWCLVPLMLRDHSSLIKTSSHGRAVASLRNTHWDCIRQKSLVRWDVPKDGERRVQLGHRLILMLIRSLFHDNRLPKEPACLDLGGFAVCDFTRPVERQGLAHRSSFYCENESTNHCVDGARFH